jgi:acyl carrier protein
MPSCWYGWIAVNDRSDTAVNVTAPQRGPLSYEQEGLYALARLAPHDAAYTVPLAVRLRGELDTGALRRALDALVERHASLRTRFVDDGGGPEQIVDPSASLPLALVDLSAAGADLREQRLADALALAVRTPFDLARGPLLRAVLYRLGEREHVLLVALHHIVTDGASNNTIVRDLSLRYNEYRAGAAAGPPPPGPTFIEHALAQREALPGAALAPQVEYWRGRLVGASTLALPTDHPRPTRPTHRGAHLDFAVPAEVAGALRALAAREGSTLFTVLLSAYHVLLTRLSGQADTVVGVAVSGRSDPRTHGVIGFFVNTLPLRTDLTGNPRFAEVLRAVGAHAQEAYAHQDVPFSQLVEGVRPVREAGRHPLYQTVLNYRTFEFAGAGWDGLEALYHPRPWTGSTAVDLTLIVEKDGPALRVRAEYALDLFEPATVARWMDELLALLAEIARDPQRRVSHLTGGTAPSVRGEFVREPAAPAARAAQLAAARAGEAEPELRSETQARLCALWATLLRTDQVGLDDDFYDLGGHSVLAIRLLNRVSEAFAVDVPVDALFDELTVRRLGEQIDALRAAAGTA